MFFNEENLGAELPLEDDAKWNCVPAPEEEEKLPELEKLINLNWRIFGGFSHCLSDRRRSRGRYIGSNQSR